MTDYSLELERIYKALRKFKHAEIRNFSQVGEVYDPKKFNKPPEQKRKKDVR